MTQDAQQSITSLSDTIITEADDLIARGQRLAETVLKAFGEDANPEIVEYQNACVMWQRKWSDVGMVGTSEGGQG